tara:strand:+ start:465 stop:701 length:237 start_codon:yes stop_codon:yes gene_type:complete
MMKNLPDYAGQSHDTAIVHEGEPISITPMVEITPHGIILTLGAINMYMTRDSAITLSDILVEGAITHMGIKFDEDFIQ